jgi:hypothetical protein
MNLLAATSIAEAVAQAILTGVGVYAALGAVMGLAFVVFGAPRIDPAARHLRWTVRLLLWPGAALLWPVMLRKWMTRQGPPVA